jgi:hypothetical protein
MSAELSGTQFDNFKSWFDGDHHLTGRAARRAVLSRRAFCTADKAQPQTSGYERRRDLGGKTCALLGFIEDMKTAAVEGEAEGTVRRGCMKKVQSGKTATQTVTIQLSVGSFDCERGDIDAEHVEAALRQPNGIRPCTRADFKRLGWRNETRVDELDKQGLRLTSVPGKFSRSVAFVPRRGRHNPTSLAPNWPPQLPSDAT